MQSVIDISDALVLDYLKQCGLEKVAKDFEAKTGYKVTDLKGITLFDLVCHFQDRFPKQKKKRRRKEYDDSKAYDEWVPIKEAYGHYLAGALNSHTGTSEVDKVVQWILDKNIAIRFLNLKYIFTKFNTTSRPAKEMIASCPKLKVGRFTTCAQGEAEMLSKTWDQLMVDAQVHDPLQCIKDFQSIQVKGYRRVVLLKRMVLGCYLCKDFPVMRHAADVFDHAMSLLYPYSTGKYTVEDDHAILEEVEKYGPVGQTWRKLKEKLNRQTTSLIRNRYKILVRLPTLKCGPWSLNESQCLVERLFSGKGHNSDRIIKSVDRRYLEKSHVTEVIHRRLESILRHWSAILKPILLMYHYGRLHVQWKLEFLAYLTDNKIMGKQHIDYGLVENMFPGVTSGLLGDFVSSFVGITKYPNSPLYVIAQEALARLKNHQDGPTLIAFREKIVFHYDRVRFNN